MAPVTAGAAAALADSAQSTSSRAGSATIGPVPGAEVHAAIAYYPTDPALSDYGRWDVARWDQGAAGDALWAGAPIIEDLSCHLVSVRIVRGRDKPLARFRPGSATLRVDDPTGRYSAWHTAAEGPVYGAIRPGIDLAVWVRLPDGSEVRRFAGLVDSIVDDWPDPVSHQVTFTAYDYSALLAAFDGTEQPPAGADETAGPRLNRIADNAEYPYRRRFDAGDVELQATTLAGNALDETGLVTDTDMGALFCDRAGVLVYRDRVALADDDRYTTIQATFGEVPPEICYAEIALAADAAPIRNLVSIARAGGSAVLDADTQSQAMYGIRTYQRHDLIHTTETESAVIAQRHLDLYAFAANRVESLTVDVVDVATREPDRLFTVLTLDVLDLIQVRRRAVGVQVVADLQVEAVGEDIAPGTWSLTFTTFPAAGVFKVGRWDVALWDTGLWGY